MRLHRWVDYIGKAYDKGKKGGTKGKRAKGKGKRQGQRKGEARRKRIMIMEVLSQGQECLGEGARQERKQQ